MYNHQVVTQILFPTSINLIGWFPFPPQIQVFPIHLPSSKWSSFKKQSREKVTLYCNYFFADLFFCHLYVPNTYYSGLSINAYESINENDNYIKHIY